MIGGEWPPKYRYAHSLCKRRRCGASSCFGDFAASTTSGAARLLTLVTSRRRRGGTQIKLFRYRRLRRRRRIMMMAIDLMSISSVMHLTPHAGVEAENLPSMRLRYSRPSAYLARRSPGDAASWRLNRARARRLLFTDFGAGSGAE